MLNVTIERELAEQVRQLAAQRARSAEEMVEEAVRHYLAEARQEKIAAERKAFEQQRNSLLENYEGECVAMHEGEVIDHDSDLRTLHLRVFERLGHTPVLLKRVSPEPERELVIRSPRLERHP